MIHRYIYSAFYAIVSLLTISQLNCACAQNLPHLPKDVYRKSSSSAHNTYNKIYGESPYYVRTRYDLHTTIRISLPGIHLAWTPKIKATKSADLKPNPTVVVRSHNGNDYSYLDFVEENLAEIGWRVIDRKNTKSTPDYIIEVGWLQFSDPSMWGTLEEAESTILGKFESYDDKYSNSIDYIKFTTLKDANKFISNRDKNWKSGTFVGIKSVFPEEWGDMNGEMRQEIIESESFRINKNVISAKFKVSDHKTGAIVATITVSELNTPSFNFPANRELYIRNILNGWENCYEIIQTKRKGYYHERDAAKWSDWAKERLIPDLCPPNLPAATCCYLDYISEQLNTGEIPFARQLSAGEDVKISDEQVSTRSNSSSKTTGQSYGYGGTNYYRYFNRSYYSGNTNSQTNSSSNETTTFTDAQWLRCSDFYGYYQPLAKRFAEQLVSLTNK